jgi:hypothetical protein
MDAAAGSGSYCVELPDFKNRTLKNEGCGRRASGPKIPTRKYGAWGTRGCLAL